jgi:hypothetical protein
MFLGWSRRWLMLWLQFPKDVDILEFAESAGTLLEDPSDLNSEDASDFALMHVVFSTVERPRAVIYDQTDDMYMPVGIAGFSVSLPYLIPKPLLAKIIAHSSPVSQPGPLRPRLQDILLGR